MEIRYEDTTVRNYVMKLDAEEMGVLYEMVRAPFIHKNALDMLSDRDYAVLQQIYNYLEKRQDKEIEEHENQED